MKPSLLTSILRRSTIKSSEKYREPQSRWFIRLKQRLTIFVSIVAVGYAVYWLQTRPSTTSDELATQVEEFDPSTRLAAKEKLSTADLIYIASNMDIDYDAPLPVLLDKIKDRMEIADKLLVKTSDELAQKEGTLYRIEALQNLSKLNRSNSMGFTTIDDQLFELCTANLNHLDPEVSKTAAGALMITAFDEYTFEPTSANLKNALSKCNQVASQLKNDDEIARAIFIYAAFKKKNEITVDDSVEFFQIIINHYLNSTNVDAKSAAENAYREIVFGHQSGDSKSANLLIAGIRDRFRQKRRSAEKELSTRIRYALNPQLFDSDALLQVMNFLEIFASIDKIEPAQNLAEEVAIFLSDLEDPELVNTGNKKIDDLQVRLDQFGKTMDLSDLEPVGEVDNDWLKPRLSLLIYWNTFDDRSQKLLRALNKLRMNQLVQCIVVCMDQDDESLKMITKLTEAMSGFTFVKLPDANPDFLDRFPVPQIPFLVLLDESQQVIGINPDFRGLGERIETLLQN